MLILMTNFGGRRTMRKNCMLSSEGGNDNVEIKCILKLSKRGIESDVEEERFFFKKKSF